MAKKPDVTFEEMLKLVQSKRDDISWNTIEDLYPELYNLKKEISDVINNTLDTVNTENKIGHVSYNKIYINNNDSGVINFGDFHTSGDKIYNCVGISLVNSFGRNIGSIAMGYDKEGNFRIIDSFIPRGEELTKNKDIYDVFGRGNMVIRRKDGFGPIISKILNELRNDKRIEFLYKKIYEKKDYYYEVTSFDFDTCFCELDSEIEKNIEKFLDKKINTKYGEVKFSYLHYSDNIHLKLCNREGMSREQIDEKENKILKSKFPDELLSYFKYYDNLRMRKLREKRSKSIEFVNEKIELAKFEGKLNSVYVDDELFFEKDKNGVKRINSKLNRDNLKYIDMFLKSFKGVNLENENLTSCNVHLLVDELYNKSLRNSVVDVGSISLSSNCDGADFRGAKILVGNSNELIMLPSFDNVIRDDETVLPYEKNKSVSDVDKLKKLLINKINTMDESEFLKFMSSIPEDVINLGEQHNGKTK